MLEWWAEVSEHGVMGSLQSSIDARPRLFHCQRSMLDLVSLADILQADGGRSGKLYNCHTMSHINFIAVLSIKPTVLPSSVF